MTLYHYCCSCSARHITDRGFLIPHGAEYFGVGLVWLTDQSVPNREGLGLTSTILKCDRLERQYVAHVQPSLVEPWLVSDVREKLITDPAFHEFEDGREPATWWIARKAVYATRNKRYEQPK